MIDWPNLIAGLILGAASSSLVFWLKYGTKLEELSKNFKAFSKYGTNIPPTHCQRCNSDVTFTLVSQLRSDGKILNTYKCPECNKDTMQYS